MLLDLQQERKGQTQAQYSAAVSEAAPLIDLRRQIDLAGLLSALCMHDAGGIDDVSAFTSRLIEEPDSMFSQGNRQAKVGLVAFLEQVKFEVRQFIEHGM